MTALCKSMEKTQSKPLAERRGDGKVCVNYYLGSSGIKVSDPHSSQPTTINVIRCQKLRIHRIFHITWPPMLVQSLHLFSKKILREVTLPFICTESVSTCIWSQNIHDGYIFHIIPMIVNILPQHRMTSFRLQNLGNILITFFMRREAA
jgi:hypothetical protein